MLNDLRYAARMLVKAPAFTLAALAALALGIGATTAMFSAVNGVLLRPLPYPEPDRLFVLRETRAQAGFERTVMAEGEFLLWARASREVEHATAVLYPGLAIAAGELRDRVPGLRVSADFFPLFGITPALGQVFTRDAEQPGRGDVAMISDDLWHRLGGRPDLVGGTVRIEGRPTTILGVLPRGFTFGGQVDAIVPMTLGAAEAAQFDDHSLDVYARLATGVSREQATAALTRTALATQGTPVHTTGAALVPMREVVVGSAGTPILVLFGAVGCVLIIACANIANLLLARSAARQKEIAVRTALGATRRRLVRQLVTESLALAAVGGALGLMLALWLTDLLARLAASSVPRANEIGLDARAFAFAALVSGLCGLVFGLAPAWHAARGDVGGALKNEARGSSAGGRRRMLSGLVSAEIALALVLLTGAGLLLKSVAHLRRVDPGFDADHVVTAPAFLPEWKYASADSQRAFFKRAITELAAVPGVTAASAVNALPLSGDNSSGSVTIEGRPAPPPGSRESTDRRAITPAYFDAMGMRLRQGRAFRDDDDETAPPVVIVSASLAEHYWPGQPAVGKRLKLGRFESKAVWRTIVGVAGDVRHGSLAEISRPVVYYPHAQIPDNGMALVIRSAAAPAAIAGGVREVLRRLDPDLPVNQLQPMRDLVASSLFNRQLELSLLGAFAVLALLLAAAGIYGVMAYAVAQRMPEFGIRLALGASGTDIVRLVVGQGLRMTAIGILAGVAAAWMGVSALSALLYDVSARDPIVLVGTAVLLTSVALAACLVPAWRALQINPLTALRAE